MPDHPSCPLCHHKETTLIATLKDERTVDIYLCQHCRTNFSHARASGTVRTDVQQT